MRRDGRPDRIGDLPYLSTHVDVSVDCLRRAIFSLNGVVFALFSLSLYMGVSTAEDRLASRKKAPCRNRTLDSSKI